MYHVIADCNDLIDHVSKESASAFEFGEIEKAKIYGEALAMRAFVHFDLLRLFAPAKDDGKRYIPYVTDINGTINIPINRESNVGKNRERFEGGPAFVGTMGFILCE